MENILATNQADVIGLGRPFATDLSAIKGLLEGTTEFLPVKEITTGVKILDVRSYLSICMNFALTLSSWALKQRGTRNSSKEFVSVKSQI